MKLKCDDGIVREFELPYASLNKEQESFCCECGEYFGIHDTKTLKPIFKNHTCDKYANIDFKNDLKLAHKIVEKTDDTFYEFNDIELAIIKNVTCAETYRDVNVSGLRMLYIIANKLKIKY